jgi:hypothetical protein
VLIVEGPDGAGKTTLVRELSREFNLKIHPKGERVDGPDGPPKQDERERVWRAIGDMVMGNKPIEIYDRLFFSELAYAPSWRGSIRLTEEEIRLVHNTLAIYGVPVIFCLPSLEQCRDNVEHSENTHPKVLPTLAEVHGRYEGFIFSGAWHGRSHWHHYDYTKEDMLNWIRIKTDIARYINLKKERTWGT